MITITIIEWFLSMVEWILNTLPSMPQGIQDFFQNLTYRLDQLIDMITAWGYLVPWDVFGLSITVAIAGFALALTIKIVRIVASFATLGGGM